MYIEGRQCTMNHGVQIEKRREQRGRERTCINGSKGEGKEEHLNRQL